jgi:hypothetical protein
MGQAVTMLMLKDSIIASMLQVCWQMLGMELLNQELRSAITETELQLRALNDAGSLTTEKAVGMTQAYHLDLGPLAVGARPRHVWVTFSNDGPLPVTWELHSFDDPEVCLNFSVVMVLPHVAACCVVGACHAPSFE